MAKNKIIKLKIRDTQSILFEGEVDRISSFNEVGPFDVYPMHANFISIIQKGITIYQSSSKLKEIKLEQAVLRVKHDVANIFVGIETIPLDDIKKSASPAK